MTIPTQPQSGMNPAAKGCLGIFVGLMLMAGCTAIAASSDEESSESSYSRSDSSSVDAGATTGDADITAAAVEMLWGRADEAQRDLLCDGLDTYGHDWVMEQLVSGGESAGGPDVIDWDLATDLYQAKCDAR